MEQLYDELSVQLRAMDKNKKKIDSFLRNWEIAEKLINGKFEFSRQPINEDWEYIWLINESQFMNSLEVRLELSGRFTVVFLYYEKIAIFYQEFNNEALDELKNLLTTFDGGK